MADPFAEIRALDLRAMHGPSYWAMRPLARLDLAIGAYEEISTAEAPGTAEALHAALPSLAAHRCSEGVPGGFLTRMARGTYAPHVIEHVALALQDLVGQDGRFGRARGRGETGEYVVVVGFEQASVGCESLRQAHTVVRHAFAGTLDAAAIDAAVVALEGARAEADPPSPIPLVVTAGVTGCDGARRRRAVDALRAATGAVDVLDLAPPAVLREGLPYRRARLGAVLDLDAGPDVPPLYRDPERTFKLLTVTVDAVDDGGTIVVPAAHAELLAHARTRAPRFGQRVIAFDGDAELDAVLRDCARGIA